jgi:polyisoprenoid-binding protein YceI
MKQFHLFVIALLLFATSYGQETWTVDNAHSNIRFEVGWEDFSIRTGEFKIFEGTMTSDSKEDLSNAIFNLKVDPNGIDVIAENLSEQLRGERFLDTEKFPEITFSASGAKTISDSTYISTGKLSIRGVEKDQDVMIWLKGHKQGRRGEMLALEVSLKLNRKDFGLEWGSPRLGETVKIVGYLLYQTKKKDE